MYTPSAGGGHARYSWELLRALATHPRAADHFQFELATARDLAGEFDSDTYTVNRILPPLRHRADFASKPAWVFDRLTHYWHREKFFLRWLAQRPDITGVHFQEWVPWLAPSTVAAVKKMGKRVYHTVHNITPHKYPRFVPKALIHRWIKASCRQTDCLFVHTDKLKSDLSKFLEAQHPPIAVMPHGVWNADSTAPTVSLSDRLKQKRLLFFGQIRRNKGLHALLDAAPSLAGYRITIAGERSDPAYFESEITPRLQQLRAAGVAIDLRDSFLPEDALPALFAEHSAIVMPYTPEFRAMSGVIYMAMAHGIPVISTPVGGQRELLAEFRVGVVTADHSTEALVTAIRDLCETGEAEHLSGQMNLAREKYSWNTAAGAVLVGYTLAQEGASDQRDCRVATTSAS